MQTAARFGDRQGRLCRLGADPGRNGALSVSLGALVADRPRICVFRVTLAMKFLNETTYRVADSTRINFVIVMQIL